MPAKTVAATKPKRWLIVAGFTALAAAGTGLIGRSLLRRPETTRDSISNSPRVVEIDVNPLSSAIGSASNLASPEVTKSVQFNAPGGVDSAATSKSSNVPGRTLVPIREKVDKRRASELQENPYR